MRSMKSFVIGVTCICVLASGCSGKDAPTDPGNNNGNGTTVDVFTPGLVFSPSFLTISLGTTIRFNITGVAHDVTFQAVTGAPQSIPVTTNQVVSRTFNTKGTFPFDCQTHPGMSGSVTVQ
jgi:plastocyanin